MFKVVTRNFSQEFGRWTDALNTAKSLQPQCKSLLQDIRIFEGEDLVWVYSRSHTYPQFVGPGAYKRLAIRFLQEAIENGEAWAMGEVAETSSETSSETGDD
ncbi:hypothetical protein H6F90_02200 [Trichocoleus sp. FACHB-591]|uniref:hypothetical protein n=1 Tax=unclassified Trichocoleus TaxID=2628910 RepID=UPI0016862775|nr:MULTISPECIES: hypothetical protein [unclassified Trichocoleus]MBD2093968.1 hypothetical protein [Trichocoleus sp. FACHB-591]MBD2122306.1 hypothetical protein [Trichocoleus sp. FACHB-262]